MSDSNDILSPDGAVLTDPGQVERALAEMWKQAGEAASGEAHQPAASRVCVANLIVVCDAVRWDALLKILGDLSPIYPTRTIAVIIESPQSGGSPATSRDKPDVRDCERLHTSPGETENIASRTLPDLPAASEAMRASVSALCHVPQPGQPQVCCEQIVLRAHQARSGDVHRTLLPLLESDVPVMVWWTLNPAVCADLLTSLAGDARRFILDAGLEGVTSLDALTRASVRDIGWYRIHRWRELIAGMFDECGPQPLDEIQELRLEVAEPLDQGLDAAGWVIAFFAGQLEWVAQHAVCDVGEPEESVERLARFEFTARGRPVVANLVRTQGEGLVGVVVRSDGNTFEARRGREELRIVVHEAHVCQTPRVVHLPRMRRGEALAAALAGRAVDAAYTRAAPLAAWMAQHLCAAAAPLHI